MNRVTLVAAMAERGLWTSPGASAIAHTRITRTLTPSRPIDAVWITADQT
ncbi:MAG: hypothetical protein KDA32_09405 [Phycisphaerales bacterium]|nr:hypothetical protein [Phycisphaerales bacterium]